MKALTVWAPWAHLIMVGAKPFEFRSYYAPKFVIGKEIVIHAGSRPIRASEVEDLMERLDDDREAWTTGLFCEIAMPILLRALAQVRYKPPKAQKVDPPSSDLFGERPAPASSPPPPAPDFDPLPLAAGLGTVRVGVPVNGNDTAKTFGVKINDSDRMAHSNWGWPMLEVKPWAEPIPMKGQQGFWDWPEPTEFL